MESSTNAVRHTSEAILDGMFHGNDSYRNSQDYRFMKSSRSGSKQKVKLADKFTEFYQLGEKRKEWVSGMLPSHHNAEGENDAKADIIESDSSWEAELSKEMLVPHLAGAETNA